jgi:hypothetical protein
MTEDKKNRTKEFQKFCEGMPLADMMKKMKEAKKGGGSFNCAEMMSQMMKMCCGAKEKKEGPSQEGKENPVSAP